MSLLDVERTPRGRRSLFVRTQLPFVVGLVYLAVVVLVISPQTLQGPWFLAGMAVAVSATALALVVPWERFDPRWMMVLAALDIVTVAFLRTDTLPVLPSVTMLATLPALWAAYAFGWAGVALGALGSAFVMAWRSVVTDQVPRTAVDWAHTITLPSAIVALSVIAVLAAGRLRAKANETQSALRAQSEALAQARDAETLVLGILDTVDAGVAMFDARGRLEVANTRARQMAEMVGFCLDTPPYVGENVMDADRRQYLPPEEQLIPRALRGEVIRDHLAWLGPPGAQIASLASATQLRRADGSVRGTVIVVHDVTELIEAVEVREQFLRTVSHELRTPLTGVTGFLSLIDDALDAHDTRVRGYLEVVTRRTNDLLDRVRDLAVATSEEPLRLREIELRPVMDAAAQSVSVLAGARGSAVEVACANDVVVRGDHARIGGAIAELMTNAIKFGEPGARVDAQVVVVGDRVRIAVSNRGSGMTDAEQRRVFDRFYRTPYARDHAVQGFGLGLSIVRAVAAAHHGHIHIDSAVGSRTTMTLELPVTGPREVETVGAGAAAPPAPPR